MKILIGGDIVPMPSNQGLFEAGNAEALVGKELQHVLQSADFRIANLEAPLTDIAAPIPKCGPNLIAPTNTVNGLKALGLDLVTLANNHIMDHKKQGLVSTVQTLGAHGIASFGAGETIVKAAKPYIISCDSAKIGIYACAEHEFTIATETKAGANPFDPLESIDHIVKLKMVCDKVIVLYHGGKEYYRYPSPMLQKACRKMVEKGADLVITQHSHCIGCEEKYLGGTIVYGQGNFIFDMNNREHAKTGLLVELDTGKDIDAIRYIPICKDAHTIQAAVADEAMAILSAFIERSTQIQQPGFVANHYRQYALAISDSLLRRILGGFSNTLMFRALNRVSRNALLRMYLKFRYSKRNRLRLLNLFDCEAWRELILEVLRP